MSLEPVASNDPYFSRWLEFAIADPSLAQISGKG
jgi:hypothetical protein